jgi:hypothetical protein
LLLTDYLRSLAIDYLHDHSNLGQPIYLYFNRQQQAKLNPTMVARILLKQAVKLADKIHPKLRTAFEKKDLPGFTKLIEMFEEYSIEFSRTTSRYIIVLFDALDECGKPYFGQIIKLLQALTDSGVRVYSTAREHYEASICDWFQIEPLRVEARVEDVRKYLTEELEQHETDVPDLEFRKEIVNEIANGVDGMYVYLR